MIDFEVSPRNSGKTTELIELMKLNPGNLYVINYNEAQRIKKTYGITAKLYDDIIRNGFGLNQWYYFDEFFTNDFINYDDIIELDKAGKNIVIRGTPVATYEPSDKFMEYLKTNWPEYCI